MKSLHYPIVVIVCIITTSVVWYITSYDPTPVTTENNFGIHALVVHSPPYMACPTEDCRQPDYYLKMNSKLRTVLVGYNVCDGNSCVEKDGLAISLPLEDVLHPDYQKLPLPDNLSWKDGDSIHIQVKVSNSFIFDNAITFDSVHTPKIWVDLGKSEIVRSS